VDEFIDWVRHRDYHHNQIQFQRSIPARRPETRSCEMNPAVTARLADRGIDELYAHQADAIDAVRGGRNVVLATPTASGKSLTYTIPAIEGARDHDGRTLYIGPQVALINDQEATLSAFAEPFDDVSVTQYTGALSDERYFGPTFPDVVSALTDDGDLTRRQTADGLEWRRTASGRTVNPYERGLRTITDRTVVLRVRGGQSDELGELPLDAALRDVHPGAIYHHQGQSYEVQSLDLDNDVAWLSPTESDQQTRVQSHSTCPRRPCRHGRCI